MEAEKTRAEAGERRLDLKRRDDGQLWADPGTGWVRVSPIRCFPWSAPGGYVSLRDDEDEEVALVPDLRHLGVEARRALEGALAEAGFVLHVVAVEELEEDIEIRCWKVRTGNGVRTFQTALDAWPRAAPDGGLLVEDVQGDVFWIPPAERLDAESRRLLFGFLD